MQNVKKTKGVNTCEDVSSGFYLVARKYTVFSCSYLLTLVQVLPLLQ